MPTGNVRNHPNATRYRKGVSSGHYESFFQRANHESRPLAFWIRYTIFSPRGGGEGLGQLWAIWFDGEKRQHVAVKSETPLSGCTFGERSLLAEIDDARLSPGALRGTASSAGHRIDWNLRFSGDSEPLLFLPEKLYAGRFPKAKALVGLPLARYEGDIEVDGEQHNIQEWVGSQNHNWGVQHTDHYAWGQVAGFDEQPRSFLEVATARLKLGPVWTPFMTPIVLRHRGREYALNGLGRALRTRGRFCYFHWEFEATRKDVAIRGRIWAPRDAFVGLAYENPPGGIKHCLNSKIASCELDVHDRESGRREVLTTRHRAAFEILTDDRSHGVDIDA